MKYLLLITVLLSGCALYWTDDVFIVTCMKDYDLKALTSTSHTIKARAVIVPAPEFEIETKGEQE